MQNVLQSFILLSFTISSPFPHLSCTQFLHPSFSIEKGVGGRQYTEKGARGDSIEKLVGARVVQRMGQGGSFFEGFPHIFEAFPFKKKNFIQLGCLPINVHFIFSFFKTKFSFYRSYVFFTQSAVKMSYHCTF